MLRAVLFDWGDTLMQYEWNEEIALAGARAGIAALEREGLPHAEAVGEWFAAREDELFGWGLVDDEVDLPDIMRACFSDLGCETTDDDIRLYLQASHDEYERGYHLGATTHALLDALRNRGLRLGLVSNATQPGWVLEPVLERQGLKERLDAIVFSSEVGKRKPHAAIFERALDELSVAPEEALFVGDRLREDVGGASALGMTTVQALWFRAEDERPDAAEPTFRAFTQMDVLNAVRRLTGER